MAHETPGPAQCTVRLHQIWERQTAEPSYHPVLSGTAGPDSTRRTLPGASGVSAQLPGPVGGGSLSSRQSGMIGALLSCRAAPLLSGWRISRGSVKPRPGAVPGTLLSRARADLVWHDNPIRAAARRGSAGHSRRTQTRCRPSRRAGSSAVTPDPLGTERTGRCSGATGM